MCGTRSACCVSSTDAAGHAGIGAGSVARAGAGFTLIELMWAMTLSLVVMAAVASLFGVFTRSLTAAQAAADLSARLRTAAWRLRQDLTGVTVDLMPPVRPESESGYFEYFEGPCRDAHAKHGYGGWGLVGDVDDVLMFTTRSEGQAFVGRFGDGTIESPVAEVAWFCRPSTVQPLDGMTLFTLYRRQKLVVPYVGRAPFDGTNSTGAASFDLNLHDLSLRLEGNVFIPNSLGDLTKRENRFLREGTAPVPFRFPFAWATGTSFAAGSLGTPPAGSVFSGQLTREFIGAGPNAPLAGVREGDDALLSNILSFDVRVYDPQARPSAGPSVAVVATAGSTRVTYNQQVSQGAGHGVFGVDGVMGAQYFAWKSGSACQSPLFPGTVTVVGNNFGDMQDPAVPKTIDLSAAATASGTTGLTFSGPMLQPGDPYGGGPASWARAPLSAATPISPGGATSKCPSKSTNTSLGGWWILRLLRGPPPSTPSSSRRSSPRRPGPWERRFRLRAGRRFNRGGSARGTRVRHRPWRTVCRERTTLGARITRRTASTMIATASSTRAPTVSTTTTTACLTTRTRRRPSPRIPFVSGVWKSASAATTLPAGRFGRRRCGTLS